MTLHIPRGLFLTSSDGHSALGLPMSYPFSLWEIPAFVHSLSIEVMPVYPSKLTSGGPCLSTEQPLLNLFSFPEMRGSFQNHPHAMVVPGLLCSYMIL